MTSALKTVLAMGLASLLIAVSAFPKSRPNVIWNASASVPIGLYRVRPADMLKRGDIVVVRPPEALADFLDRGRYLPHNVPLLKHVAALRGERVCRNGMHVLINGLAVADALPHDHLGRPLPHWSGCITLTGEQVFLLNPDRPDSLDGRYFGPLDIRTVVGRAEPLWIEAEAS